VIAIALFCWATASAFSIFSELKFLVDGWTWSVDQVPITVKVIALAVGKWVSGIVGGYREFIHGLVQMLHLPRLPQPVYDAAGVAAFSIGRGRWIGNKSFRAMSEIQIQLPDDGKFDWADYPRHDKLIRVRWPIKGLVKT
jgi:hypothetical protein